MRILYKADTEGGGGGGNLVETVEFRAVAPNAKLAGLDQALKKLTQLDTVLKTVQNRLAGLTTGSNFKLSAAQFTEKVPTKGVQDVRKLARAWGFPDVADLQNVAREVENELQKSITRIQNKLDKLPARSATRGSTKARDALKSQIEELKAQSFFTDATATKFKNPTRAGLFAAEKYAPRLLTNKLDVNKAILGLLSGTAPMAMPAAMFPVQPPIAPPAKAVAKAAKAESTEPVADKASRSASAKFNDAFATIKRELAENLNTADPEKISRAHAGAASQVRGLVDSMGDKLKSRQQDKALEYAAKRETAAEKANQQAITAGGENVFTIRKKLAAAEAAGQKEKAKQLKQELDAEQARVAGLKQLDQVFYKPHAKQQAARAKNAADLAAFEANRAAGLGNVAAVSSAWQNFIANGGVVTKDEMIQGKGGMKRQLRGELKQPDGQTRIFSASIGEADAKLSSYAKTVADAKQKTGWLGSDFLTNTAKVAKWSMSVGLLYKTLALAEHSFESFLTASGQMARLDQIFRGVGGTTRELTSDILHLAAVTGRSGEEAMESAISWSRLGLNRVQVNEAVRTSLMAANVTQLTAAETTEHLQAISQNYGLSIGTLAAKLGEMVRISNVYNVTNADMLQGVSRSAAVAKQAGVSFESLIGLIGATVGATKQTGANIGNAIKTIVTSLGSPVLQEKLRMLYGIRSESGGRAKPVTDVLDQIYIRYQKLDSLQQRAMTFSISGKFQSQRLSAMLDNYVRAQVLAIDAQLHLNTAEQENLKIVGSLKSQLAGLSAEWERFVVVQGTNGPAQALGEIATALKNVLSLLDSKGGSVLTTMMLGIGTAAVAKTALTAMTTKAGAQSGFVGATQSQALVAAMALNGFTNQAIQGFHDRSLQSATKARNARYANLRTQNPLMTAGQAYTLSGGAAQAGLFAQGLMGMNNFSNERLSASAKAFREMRVAAGAANAVVGATVKSIALASAALVEFAIPIALVVGGIWLFNKAMDAMEGGAEASRKRLAGFNEEMERSAAAAGAMGQASKLFQTAITAMSPMQGYGAISKTGAFRMFDQMQDAIGLNEPDLKKRKNLQATTVRSWKDTFVEGGDNSKIAADMAAQRDNYQQAQRDQLRANMLERRRAQEELAGQQQKLETMNQSPTLWDRMAGGVEKRNQQIEEIKGKQAALTGQIVQFTQEELAVSDEQLSTDQQVTLELAKQKGILEALDAVFSSMHASNPLEKWMVSMTAGEARLMALKKQLAGLQQQERSNTAEQAMLAQKSSATQKKQDDALAQLQKYQSAQAAAEAKIKNGMAEPVAYAETSKNFGLDFSFSESNNGEATFKKKIDDLKSQIDTLQSRRDDLSRNIDPDNLGQVTNEARLGKLQADKVQQIREQQNELEKERAKAELALRQTEFEMGGQRADRQHAGQDYGVSEGDRLIRERKYLTDDIAQLEERINSAQAHGLDTMAERGQLAQDIYLREKDTLDLLTRQETVKRDIKQLQIDTNKEFMKSFMGAGPAEMLQKLAAFRMAFDKNGKQKAPLSQGAFFAMSPGMRGDYGQLNPQYNPQMMFLKQEQKQIKDAIIAAFGSSKPKDVDKGLLEQSAAFQKMLGGLKDTLSDALTGIANDVKTSGGGLVKALEEIAEGVRKAFPAMAPTPWTKGWMAAQTAQAGGLGGGAGWVVPTGINLPNLP